MCHLTGASYEPDGGESKFSLPLNIDGDFGEESDLPSFCAAVLEEVCSPPCTFIDDPEIQIRENQAWSEEIIRVVESFDDPKRDVEGIQDDESPTKAGPHNGTLENREGLRALAVHREIVESTNIKELMEDYIQTLRTWYHSNPDFHRFFGKDEAALFWSGIERTERWLDERQQTVRVRALSHAQ